jgi:hypothetical protein
MKRLIIAAVGLALVVGIIVGGMVGNPLEGKASASTAAGQQREDQVILSASPLGLPFSDWGFLTPPTVVPYLAVDTADYPGNSTFRFEAVLWINESSTGCARLFDLTDGTVVSGTELCHTTGQSAESVRLRSEPMDLPSGEQEYSLQGWYSGGGGGVLVSRVIVEWTGPSAVGGFAELPALAGTGASGMGGATYAVLAGAAAGVLAFAVLATLSVKRRRVR